VQLPRSDSQPFSRRHTGLPLLPDAGETRLPFQINQSTLITKLYIEIWNISNCISAEPRCLQKSHVWTVCVRGSRALDRISYISMNYGPRRASAQMTQVSAQSRHASMQAINAASGFPRTCGWVLIMAWVCIFPPAPMPRGALLASITLARTGSRSQARGTAVGRSGCRFRNG
jgi:hypothetical protein